MACRCGETSNRKWELGTRPATRRCRGRALRGGQSDPGRRWGSLRMRLAVTVTLGSHHLDGGHTDGAARRRLCPFEGGTSHHTAPCCPACFLHNRVTMRGYFCASRSHIHRQCSASTSISLPQEIDTSPASVSSSRTRQRDRCRKGPPTTTFTPFPRVLNSHRQHKLLVLNHQPIRKVRRVRHSIFRCVRLAEIFSDTRFCSFESFSKLFCSPLSKMRLRVRQ